MRTAEDRLSEMSEWKKKKTRNNIMWQIFIRVESFLAKYVHSDCF